MQLRASIFCACRAHALFRGKASHATWRRKPLASKAFLLTSGVFNSRFRAAHLLHQKTAGQKCPAVFWRRRRDYLRATPLMASSAGKVSVPFLHHASPPPRTHSCEFTILSNLSSASKNGGAKMPCRFLAQKTRLSAGYALDGFVGGKSFCPFPAPCFAASSHALV